MSYLHIENLYKAPDFLQCYALEKVHGTSAHVAWIASKLVLFAGGVSHAQFITLFDIEALEKKFAENFKVEQKVFVYGEAFGGGCQRMSHVYGKDLRFVAFDVKIDDDWLRVPSAEGFCKGYGIPFIPYEQGPIALEWLNSQRDRDSLVAIKPGCMREGIVIRPIHEQRDHRGERVIYKHKRDEFKETKTPREVDPARVAVLEDAAAVAEEWVTPMRLDHVLQKTPFNDDKDTATVLRAMVEDVKREGEGEIVWSKDVEKAICRATASILHKPKLPV